MRNGSTYILTNKDGSTEKVRLIYYPVKGVVSDTDHEQKFSQKHIKDINNPLFIKSRKLHVLLKTACEEWDYFKTPQDNRLALIEPVNKTGEYRYVQKKYLKSVLMYNLTKLISNVRNKRKFL